MILFFLLLPWKLAGASVFNSAFIIANQFLVYPSMLLYFISVFAAICCCKPETSSKPCSALLAFQIFSCILLLIASFLGYAGAKILSTNGWTSSYDNDYFNELQSFVKDPFQANTDDIKNIYDNNIKSIKSLINITNQYNLTFSENTGKYRISFNNIYFNPYASNYLKISLKRMDQSRNQILNQVISFAEKYQNYSNVLQNSSSEIMKNNFNSGHHKKHIKWIAGFFFAGYSYFLSTCILILPILCTIIYFFANKCSRCCFCTYPIYALLIVSSTFITCYHVMDEDYDDFDYICNRKYPLPDRKTKSAIFKNASNFFSEEYSKEVEVLIQKISSKRIHDDYESVYQQYEPNPAYASDLNQMVSVIKQKDVNLLQMKELIENIANSSFSAISSLSESPFFNVKLSVNSIKPLKSERNVLYSREEVCGKILEGMNCCVLGQFFLTVGLLLMLISVCKRRKEMLGNIKVQNTQDQYIMGDEVQDIIYFDCSEKGRQRSNGEQQSIEDMYPHAPMSLDELHVTEIEEGIWKVYLGTRLVYHATTYAAAQSILRDQHLIKGDKGMFGPGIYFAATLEIAKHKCRQKVGAYVICKVDFGYAIVLQRPNKTLTLDDIRRYGCDSVMGRSGPGTDWEFIVYESERTLPIQMFRLKQKDEDNHARSEDEDIEDDEDDEGQIILIGLNGNR